MAENGSRRSRLSPLRLALDSSVSPKTCRSSSTPPRPNDRRRPGHPRKSPHHRLPPRRDGVGKSGNAHYHWYPVGCHWRKASACLKRACTLPCRSLTGSAKSDGFAGAVVTGQWGPRWAFPRCAPGTISAVLRFLCQRPLLDQFKGSIPVFGQMFANSHRPKNNSNSTAATRTQRESSNPVPNIGEVDNWYALSPPAISNKNAIAIRTMS